MSRHCRYCGPDSRIGQAPASAPSGWSDRRRQSTLSAASSVRVLLGHDRQMQTELGASRSAVDLDQTAMIADDLGDQGKTQPAARGLGRDERLEQMRSDILGYARPVVADRDI